MDRIYLVNQLNAHRYSHDLLAEQYRLRKRVCIDWRGWRGRSIWSSGEYDEFDTPAANYFIWLDEIGTARGMMRAVPTTVPYMQKKLWPNMVTGHAFPCSQSVWEISRVCFEAPVLGQRTMRRVMQLVMAGISEWAAEERVLELWWMTYTKFARICPGKHNIHWLGPEQTVDGDRCRAGRSYCSELVSRTTLESFQVRAPVLDWRTAHEKREAA